MIADHKVIPVLKVLDVAKAKGFYIDVMGFNLDWEKELDQASSIYMIMSYKHIILYFTNSQEEAIFGSKVFIEFSELREYHRFLMDKKNENVIADLNMSPWESLSMEVIDPFGNKLLFCEPFSG